MPNTYIVNSNMCGYLPSDDGISVSSASEALETLISMVSDAADAAYETGEGVEAEFDAALSELRALRARDVRCGYEIIIGDECFFIAALSTGR